MTATNINVKEMIESYWDWRSESYHAEFLTHITEEIEIWKRTFSPLIPNPSGVHALEIATGPGIIAMALASMGCQVSAIDLSPKMIIYASRLADAVGVDITFSTGDAEHLSFLPLTFDFVISKYLLWTLPHPSLYFSECYRVLKPNGICAVIDSVWHHKENGSVKQSVSTEFETKYDPIKSYLPHFYENSAEHVHIHMNEAGFSEIQQVSLSEFEAFLKKYDTEYAVNYTNPLYLLLSRK